jgi:glycosyltransferase involved in cell wall biosynthesis
MISVLISVYKNDNIDDFTIALESVYLHQLLKPSEIVIIFDGPVKYEIENFITSKIIESWPIKLVKLPRNVGLGKALNLGLLNCTFDLVARMDSDDISNKERFLTQFNFLNNNPNIDIVGGYIQEFNESGEILYKREVPLNDNEIKKTLSYKNSMNHVTVMFRKSRLALIGNYEEAHLSFEDYGTWLKGKKILKYANIPKILVKVKVNSDFANRRSGWKYFIREFKFFKKYYENDSISLFWLLINTSSRFALRNMPSSLLLRFYKFIRTKS